MESANHVSKRTKLQFPDDLIPDIFTQLPVKSLLRFRCVSKSWNSHISDPEFSKLQHKPPCLLLYKVEEDPLRYSILNLANNCEDSVDLSWRRSSSDYGRREILGSCNGLVCVRYDGNGVIVGNPSTRKFRHVKTDLTDSSHLRCYGFGYDKSADDYKLVRAGRRKPSTRTEFYVFQLKSNKWRKIQDINYKIGLDEHGVLLDGALHWTGYDWQDFQFSRAIIVVLDLATEKFKFLPTPGLDHHPSNTLTTIGGSLCLCYKGGHRSRKVDVWIMKEYGVSSSWTKLFTILPESVDRYGYCPVFEPLLVSGEEEIMAIINGNVLATSNIKSLKFKDVLRLNVPAFCPSRRTILHRESLVSI